MSDSTSFDHIWVINNATSTLATGKASSEEWTEGGFNWMASLNKVDSYGDFALNCGVNHNGEWKCSGTVKFDVLDVNGEWVGQYKNEFNLDERNCNFIQKYTYQWAYLMDPYVWNVNDTITAKFHIEVTSSSGGNLDMPPNIDTIDLSHISFHDDNSNVTLVIGDKKVDVCKEFLAMFSPVFDTMFFGDFKEKGKKEIEVKDVDHEEFMHLMSVISPDPVDISDATVLAIAKLADQFQIKSALKSAEKHLLSSNKFTSVQKMQFADKYRFVKLRDHCLKSYKNVQDLKVYTGTLEYSAFSDGTKAAILDRIMQLFSEQ